MGTKTILHIENLDCPVCAEALQSDLQKIKGVQTVAVDYITQTITLETEDEEVISRVIKKTEKFEQVRVLDGGRYEVKAPKKRKEWLFIALSALFLIGGILLEHFTDGTFALVARYALYALAYLAVGYPVLLSTVKNLAKGRVFDENFLMTVASIGAIVIGETSEGVLVMLLYQLGELLQSIAVGSSRQSVARLMDLKSEKATLLVDGEQKTVSPEELKAGDILLVKAGEKTPVDGVLLSESAVLDTKSLTGEAELRTVNKGEELLSGCINAGGVYEMKVLRPYEDSAVGRILDLVENASAGKAKPEKFISKFARVYTPIVCCLAVAMAILMPLASSLLAGEGWGFLELERWVQSALTFLVISCPCALVISVPLTYFSGIGVCAKAGILVKGATYLDVLAKANIVAFDKTGTLTEGNFTVCKLSPASGVEEGELLAIATAVERSSSHPIAKAFAGYDTDYTAEDVVERAGSGLIGKIMGRSVLIGTEKLLRENRVPVDVVKSAYTVLYVAVEGRFLGSIEVGDKLRAETKTVLKGLNKQGISRLVMLTGDGEQRAWKIANEAGIYEVNAQLLPDQKLVCAEELKAQGKLVYVGDGVNDAPVMAAADCSVSMGKLGSAAAVEASDLVLIADDLRVLPKAINIARKTRAIVMQNIVFSLVMKLGFMVLGALGVLPLWLAVFADVGVMLLAVLNSFRVRRIK
ncbi:MAG: heavy metal translocating P-type ATPase [Clostridia bacterium]|nr:heavy metal translocating P-type ATPase [Clostridia bacterium]